MYTFSRLTKIELTNLGGGVNQKWDLLKSMAYVFFRGGSQKCMFVEKGGGGVKNAQKCVYVIYGCPLRYLNFPHLFAILNMKSLYSLFPSIIQKTYFVLT